MSSAIIDILRLERRWQKIDTAALQDADRGISFMELPTARIRLRRAGHGTQTLVFTCDPPNVVEQYDGIIERLGSHFNIVVLEQPGMGFSFPKKGFGFTREDYVSVLLGVLKHLAIGPYTLVSPCASAYTAMFAAEAAPQLIERLVLLQATGWAEELIWIRELAKVLGMLAMGVPAIGHKVVGTPYLGQLWSAATERWFPTLTTGPSVYRARRRSDFQERFMAPHKAAFAHGACNCQVSMYQHFFVGDDAAFAKPRQPALVLWGCCDISHDNSKMLEQPGVRGALARAMVNPIRSNPHGLLKYVPQAAVVEMAETGHFVELENSDQTCREILEFMKR